MSIVSIASQAQDTVRVKAFDYSSVTRDTSVSFPTSNDKYEKILMLYSMRCKNGLVSDGNDRNKGCGEWDYSCNTYIEDNNRIDSLLSSVSNYTIPGFSGSSFNYTTSRVNNIYANQNLSTVLDSSNNAKSATVGNMLSALNTYLSYDKYGGGAYSRSVYTAAELNAAGLDSGFIHELSLFVDQDISAFTDLKIFLANTSDSSLFTIDPTKLNKTQVYAHPYTFVDGKNTFLFSKPFLWDGKSNIVLWLSGNGNAKLTDNIVSFASSDVSGDKNGYSHDNRAFHFDGATYLEAQNFKGILGTTERSIDAWIKTETVNGEIVSWGTDRGGEKWVFRINGDGTLRVEVNGGNIVGTTLLTDGKWHHVACTFKGNSVDDIKLYVDGNVEAIGSKTNRTINTTSGINARVSRGVNNRYFNGSMDLVRIWDLALTADQVKQAKTVYFLSDVAPIHNVCKYDFYRVTSSEVYSDNQDTRATIFGQSNVYELRDFELSNSLSYNIRRPQLELVQGDFFTSKSTSYTYDSIPQIPYTVFKNTVIPNHNTTTSDVIVPSDTFLYYSADLQKNTVYDENGDLINEETVSSENTITITPLPYYRRWPSSLEIMSFVTPYGIGLDLGQNGKTWTFDVTDFTPILNGNKRMYLSRGGQNQEEMDIEFLFIKGTPSRDVLDIKQLWPTAQYSANYTQIQENSTYFPPIDVPLSTEGKEFKIRSAITGHGQEGEFIPRYHTISVEGINYDKEVWKACGDNPIHPQGGTWIYDRAGWCPGMATDVTEYDITPLTSGKDIISVDYNVLSGSGDSRYIVNNQLVTYGSANFTLDAAILDIKQPSKKVEYAKTNPTCQNPTIMIQNNGTERLKSVKIKYYVNDPNNFKVTGWNGDLGFQGKEEFDFIINEHVWSTANNYNSTFFAEIIEVNGKPADDYAPNNIFASPFDLPTVIPSNIYFMYFTNTAPQENIYRLYNGLGEVIYERMNLSANTLYRDTMKLNLGCHTLEITDSDNDGISFWANNDGNGLFRIMEVGGGIITELNGDFGSRTQLNFTVDYPLSIDRQEPQMGYKCYPNPTNGMLTIESFDMDNADCSIYNSFGQLITRVDKATGTTVQIDLSNQPSGIYFVKVNKGETEWTSKVLVE